MEPAPLLRPPQSRHVSWLFLSTEQVIPNRCPHHNTAQTDGATAAVAVECLLRKPPRLSKVLEYARLQCRHLREIQFVSVSNSRDLSSSGNDGAARR